jgi:hypothetical protein
MFDARTFNCLPRPSVEAALREASVDSLGLIFPYLFKPNRVAAQATGDSPSAFPHRDFNLRWLFRLPVPDGCPGRYFAAVARDGVLRIWRYRLTNAQEPGRGGGLEAVPLERHADSGPRNVDYLRLDHRDSAPASLQRFLSLPRFGCRQRWDRNVGNCGYAGRRPSQAWNQLKF